MVPAVGGEGWNPAATPRSRSGCARWRCGVAARGQAPHWQTRTSRSAMKDYPRCDACARRVCTAVEARGVRARPRCCWEGGPPSLAPAAAWAAANKGRARMGQRRAAARLPSGGRPVKALTCAGDAMDLKATIDAMRAQMRLRVGSRSTIVCCAFTVSCEGGRALTSTKLGVVLRWRPTPPAPGLVIVFHVFNVSVRWQGGHGPAEKAFCDF